jgi:hypothetical protein
MATYYFRNTGNVNWGNTDNWSSTDGGPSAGVIPGSGDDAYFTSNSGNCTVDTIGRVCASLVFAGVGAGNYTGTFTLTQQLNAFGTAITLSPSMTLAGSNQLIMQGNATLTSNGKICNLNIRPSNATFTLADNWIVTGSLTLTGGTYNNNSFYVRGNLSATTNTLNSTTNLIIDGTGNQSINSLFRIALPITINKASGTLTINSIAIGNSFTYIAGSVVMPATFVIGNAVSVVPGTTITAGALIFNAVTIDLTGTVTLAEPMYVSGTLSYGGFTRSPVFNGSPIYARGNVTSSLGSGVVSGTSELIIDGTTAQTVSTPSATSGSGGFGVNITLNNPLITFTRYFSFRSLGTNATLTALQPAGADTSSILYINFGTCTVAASKVSWNRVFITMNSSASGALTLAEDLYVNSLLALGSLGVPTTVNGSTIYAMGDVSFGMTITQLTGTTNIHLMGRSSQTITMPFAASTGALRNNLTINNKNVVFNGPFRYNTGTLTFLTSAKASSATLIITGSIAIVNPHLVPWYAVQITSGLTITCNEFFSGNASTQTLISASSTTNYTISFTDSFEKFSKFIKISNATVTNRGQLLILTQNWNKGNNLGIRSINSSPNKAPEGLPTVDKSYVENMQDKLLITDPNTVSRI